MSWLVTAGMSDGPAKVLRNLFFTKTNNGIKSGEQFLEGLQLRKENRDIPTAEATVNAQATAIITYGHEKRSGISAALQYNTASFL